MRKGVYFFGGLLLGSFLMWYARPEINHYIIDNRLKNNQEESRLQETNIYGNEDRGKLLGPIKLRMTKWNRSDKELVGIGDEGTSDEAYYKFEYDVKNLEAIFNRVKPEEPKGLVSN